MNQLFSRDESFASCSLSNAPEHPLNLSWSKCILASWNDAQRQGGKIILEQFQWEYLFLSYLLSLGYVSGSTSPISNKKINHAENSCGQNNSKEQSFKKCHCMSKHRVY